MRKGLSRLIALVLSAALIVDPSTAASLKVSSMAVAAGQAHFCDRFPQEAFTLPMRYVLHLIYLTPALFAGTRLYPKKGLEGGNIAAGEFNKSVQKRLAAKLSAAREKGLFGVLSVAMEMPTVDKHGVKMNRQGPGGGGQGIYMAEQPWAIQQEG